jgi:hypothetical protein
MPLYKIPRERRAEPAPQVTTPKPGPQPRPEQLGQGELFTRRQARATQPRPPRRPKRPNLTVIFQAPDYRDEETS